MDEKKTISVVLPATLLADVKSAALAEDMSMTAFIKYVLRMYLYNNDKGTVKGTSTEHS